MFWTSPDVWVVSSQGINQPVAGEPDPLVPGAAVLRGASTATPRRSVHPRARRFAADTDDQWPCGFRSCAV